MTTVDRQSLAIGLVTGSVLTVIATFYLYREKETNARRNVVDGVDGLIGNTPLMRIRSLSEATGCTILVCLLSCCMFTISYTNTSHDI